MGVWSSKSLFVPTDMVAFVPGTNITQQQLKTSDFFLNTDRCFKNIQRVHIYVTAHGVGSTVKAAVFVTVVMLFCLLTDTQSSTYQIKHYIHQMKI